jgi:hypothetical protein
VYLSNTTFRISIVPIFFRDFAHDIEKIRGKMKALRITILFVLFFGLQGFSQVKLPIQFRVEKQSMSTPMSVLEDVLFANTFYTKPVNVHFDGFRLNLTYDNGATYVKKELVKVTKEEQFEDNMLAMETFIYTDSSNPSDTILFVVDHNVGYYQVILPSKNSKGEYYGYSSFKKFINEDNLALK